MLHLNCNVLTTMQYVHCLRNVHNQSIAICRQIMCVDIEVEYFCDNIVYHYPTLVFIFLQIQCTKSSMELVWKIVFHSILEIFHSIPFWHLPYSIPKFPFHSIPCPVEKICLFQFRLKGFWADCLSPISY